MMSDSANVSKDRSIAIMTRLKQETKDYHARLETLPYFAALIAHKLPLECYVSQLRSLAIIHGVLENEIATSKDRVLSSVWKDEIRKLSLLEEDLEFFQPRVISDFPAPVQAALAMTEKIRLRQIENPVTLLGYLYVFEGSTLGNSMHRPDISTTFHLAGLNGCCYYSSYHEQVQSHWNKFTETMNSALNDSTLHDAIIQSAHEAFLGLEVLYKALYPLDPKGKTHHVTRINPEAGNHPIPDDEREIAAAIEASNRGWNAFPYYEQRYGKRGKRFSDSDTCWLVTLVRLDQENLQKQVEWLGRVLVTRGMPSIMLEQTLRFLHEELVKAVPENALPYEKLVKSADFIKAERETMISESDLEALSGEFNQAVGPKMAERFRNTGKLLASSAADERNGIEGAMAALQEWMTDENRFPPDWIAAVKHIIDKASKL